MKKFIVSPSNHSIWNRLDLEKFLVDNQNQDIHLAIQNEGCDCSVIGLYDLLDLFQFASVEIQTSNCLEKHHKYKVTHKGCFKAFECTNDPTTYQPYHIWNRHKLFGIFYNRPIWHRLGLLAHLYKEHRDLTLINFRSDPMCIDSRELFEIDQLFVNHPESAKKFLDCYSEFPLLLEEVDTYTLEGTTTKHTDQLCHHYPNILIDIVAEPFTTGNTFYPTEKTVRPMLLKKPMIVMTGRDQLLYLRQMGFMTFNDFWDETYDGFEGKDRYIKILKVIDDLAKKSMSEMESMYQAMQPVLQHNHDLLIESKFKKRILQVTD